MRRRSAEEASILSKGSMGTQGSLDELSQLEPILVKVLHRHARPSFKHPEVCFWVHPKCHQM